MRRVENECGSVYQSSCLAVTVNEAAVATATRQYSRLSISSITEESKTERAPPKAVGKDCIIRVVSMMCHGEAISLLTIVVKLYVREATSTAVIGETTTSVDKLVPVQRHKGIINKKKKAEHSRK